MFGLASITGMIKRYKDIIAWKYHKKQFVNFTVWLALRGKK
jgi:hypothetical protein